MNSKAREYNSKNCNKIKKRLSLKYFFSFIVITFFLLFQFFIIKPLYADEDKKSVPRKYIDTVAVSAIVEDFNSDRILWEKNSDEIVYPASITKIMTAIIVLENTDDLHEIVKISKNAKGRNFSSIYFRINDRITVEDLLKAALISSNNNATIALAEHVSGNEKDFVKLMNQKAKEIGALNTNFENTNGLDSDNPGHRSTAKDLIKIAKYCMSDSKFREIVSLKEANIYINDEEIIIKNTNSLLDGDFIKGIKTGYTNNAGFCLMTYSEKENIEIICAIMGSSLYGRNYDTLRLINWIYDNYEYKKIISKEEAIVSAKASDMNSNLNFDLFPEKDISILFNDSEDNIYFDFDINHNITFPVSENKSYGELSVFLNGHRIEKLNLYSNNKINSPKIEITYFESTYEKLIEYLLIFTLSFYFSAFAFIIIKNLIRLKSN
ncbi:MAG: D-alanyl-D-alanine carboxypeptidase [Actinomycetota bacterium]|nr:D-alanyl-D-alanine carboxypeptidase [Actinomycetota bacterium]